MITQNSFEFECTLNDGRTVYVTGEALVALFGTTPRILELDVESVEQTFAAGTIEGSEIHLNTRVMREIEHLATDYVYNLVRAELAS